MNRVLITRPRQTRTTSLLRNLTTAGWQPIHIPLIRYVECERKALPPMKNYDLLLCVSRYAAEIFIRELTETAQSFVTVPQLLTPGKQTAAYLKNHGLNAVYPVAGVGSEALLTMGRLNRVHNRKILLLSGQETRKLLERTLKERGARVDRQPLYRCEPLYYSQRTWEEAAPLKLLWVTSGQILRALLENVRDDRLSWIYDSLLVLGSERLVKMTKSAPFKRKTFLPAADNETFMEYIATMG